GGRPTLVTVTPKLRGTASNTGGVPDVQRVRDQRIETVVPLMSPALLHHELPLTADLHDGVLESRRQVEDVIQGRDPRLLVVVGPCSVHDPVAAGEYASL